MAAARTEETPKSSGISVRSGLSAAMPDLETPMPTPTRLPLIRLDAAMLLTASLLAVAAAPAFADGFAGTWAADLAHCRSPQSSADAPLVLTGKGYDQHEAHCTFEGLKAKGAAEWAGRAACSVEGDRQSIAVNLTVSGDTLTLTEDGSARDLLRCP